MERRNAEKNRVPERAERGTQNRNRVPELAERGTQNRIGFLNWRNVEREKKVNTGSWIAIFSPERVPKHPWLQPKEISNSAPRRVKLTI